MAEALKGGRFVAGVGFDGRLDAARRRRVPLPLGSSCPHRGAGAEVTAEYNAGKPTRLLTVKLRGRQEVQAALRSNEALQSGCVRPIKRRGRILSFSARGADMQAVHGPLQRLLEVTLPAQTVRVRRPRRK